MIETARRRRKGSRRFANEPLSWEMIANWACSIEMSASNPTYPFLARAPLSLYRRFMIALIAFQSDVANVSAWRNGM